MASRAPDRFRIRPVPFEPYQGQPVLYDIPHSEMRRQPDPGEGGLLSEAIRFYNFGADRATRIAVKSSGWKPLDPNEVLKALRELRLAWHTAALRTMGRLVLPRKAASFLPETIQTRLRWRHRGNVELNDPAYGSIYTVRAMLDPIWRRKGGAGLRIPAFERLTRCVVELRSLIARPSVEQMLLEQYGAGPGVCPPYAPWGGTRAIMPHFDRLGRLKITDFRHSFYRLSPQESGPTEKLYCLFASKVFRGSHRIGVRRAEPHSVSGCRFLDRVRDKVDEILTEVLPALSGVQQGRWGRWMANLRLPEARFGHAIRSEAVAKEVGLPWALALAGVLRGYLCDLMCRTFMVSLPICSLYDKHSGIAAVALLEALTGTPQAGPSVCEVLDIEYDWRPPEYGGPERVGRGAVRLTPELLGRLDDWQSSPSTDIWGKQVRVNRSAMEFFSVAQEIPLIQTLGGKVRKTSWQASCGFDKFGRRKSRKSKRGAPLWYVK